MSCRFICLFITKVRAEDLLRRRQLLCKRTDVACTLGRLKSASVKTLSFIIFSRHLREFAVPKIGEGYLLLLPRWVSSETVCCRKAVKFIYLEDVLSVDWLELAVQFVRI